MDPPSHAVGIPRQFSWTHLAFAVSFLVLYPVDIAILGRADLGTLVLRCVWAALLVLYATLAHRVSLPGQRLWDLLSGLIDTLFFLALIQLTGGTSSPYFTVLITIPIFVAQSYPTQPLAALVSGVTGGAGALVLMRAADRSWLDTLLWSFMTLAGSILGMHGATQSRRIIAVQEQARSEQSRRELVERLARREYARAHSDKLATLGRLAANVLHELNNPLAFVRSNLEFLRRELLEPRAMSREELLEVLDETRSGVERIQQISSDLRSFSRVDNDGPARCSLAEVIRSTLRIAALRLQHVANVSVEFPEHLPDVYASPQRMVQVLLNLLVNAGDALAQRKEGAEVCIIARQEGARIILLVEDNGPGIPPDVLPRLFEAFFTTKGPEHGTGLGLALSRELLEKFHGTLTAENRPEGGARMRITLQALPDEHEAPEEPPSEAGGASAA